MVFMVSMTLNSCKKCDSGTPAPVGMGHLYFHLHTDMQTTEVDSGNSPTNNGYPDALGRRYYLTSAQFFISSITIYNYTTNAAYTLPITTGMCKYIDNEDYYIADVPAGNYGSVSYNIGLTPAEAAESPGVLFPQFNSAVNGIPSTSMWDTSWNAAPGYIYLNVSGVYYPNPQNLMDTVVFSYQIGAGASPYHVQLPQQQFTVLADTITFVHQICDYGNLLQGVSFAINNATTNGPNAASADSIANRISSNFMIYEMATIKP